MMARPEELFKCLPNELSALDRRSAANALGMRRAIQKADRVSLMIGSGVSASAGLPDWGRLVYLVAGTFFEHWNPDMPIGRDQALIPPKALQIGGIAEEAWTDYVRDLAKAATIDPVLSVQQIKNCIRPMDWKFLLRKALYDYSDSPSTPSALLTKIVEFVQAIHVVSIVNYNYDDTLLRALRDSGIHVVALWHGMRDLPSDELREYHPHGLLARDGGPDTELVFAEAEYQQESAEPYSWGNLVQLNCLSGSLCVFVGVSMRDPNLRRLLRIAARSPRDWHFAVLPRTVGVTGPVVDSLFDLELARLRVKVIRYDLGAPPDHHALVPVLIHYAAGGLEESRGRN